MKRLALLVLIAGMVSSAVIASPDLQVKTASTNPKPVTAGDKATVYVTLQNLGPDAAKEITVRYQGHRLFKLLHPEDKEQTVSLLGSQEDITLTYEVIIPDDAPAGSFSLPFKISAENTRATLEKGVSVDIQATKSLLHIENASTTPSPLRPGQQGSITLTAVNKGDRAIHNVDVTLDVKNTPFLPVDQTNTKRTETLLPGEQKTITFQVAAKSETESALYKAPFKVSYEDATGNKVDKTVYTGVKVSGRSDLFVTVRDTELTTAKRTGEIRLSVVNKGLANLKLARVTLLNDSSYQLKDTSSYYVGDIESDDFDVLTFNIKAQNTTLKLPVRVTYRTAFNKERTITQTATYTLPKGDKSSGIIWYIVAVAIVAGGAWWYKRR